MSERRYIIGESQLRSLLLDANRALALAAGGVDNWPNYTDSINDFIYECGFESMHEIVEDDLSNFIKIKED
jgi:hypothetical protein